VNRRSPHAGAAVVVSQFEAIVKGHDFSRAAEAQEMKAGFSP
jgi:hypothetical protein